MNHKTSHDADAAMLSELPLATGFVTSFFLGRGEYARHESATLECARVIALEMAAHYRNGRKALVYAQLPSGRQFLVPDSYQPETSNQKETTMKSYNKKSNAKRAAESLAKRFPGYTVADPVAAETAGEWFPALMAPKATIDEGVPPEIASAACVNGKAVGAVDYEAAAKKAGWEERELENRGLDRAWAHKDDGAEGGVIYETAQAVCEDQGIETAPAPTPKPIREQIEEAATKRKAAKPAKPKAARKPRPAEGDPLTPPDFSAKTHERFRGKLATLVALVEARDIAGIKRFHVNPSSTSPKAIMRYKERVLAALEAS